MPRPRRVPDADGQGRTLVVPRRQPPDPRPTPAPPCPHPEGRGRGKRGAFTVGRARNSHPGCLRAGHSEEVPLVANAVKRPCLDCQRPTTGSRCSNCRSRRDRTARAHYAGNYKGRAAELQATHPHGPCHLCGETIVDPAEWSAHHVDPGNPDSPLRPAHLGCNQSFGQGGQGSES